MLVVWQHRGVEESSGAVLVGLWVSEDSGQIARGFLHHQASQACLRAACVHMSGDEGSQ